MRLPTQVDRFPIIRPLGSGGSGVVLLAREPNSGRELALKLFPLAAGGSEKHLRRFQREVAALRELAHPNLVRLVADGVTGEGVPWLAMERVPGVTLAARLARGPLPLAEALSLARQLAAALAAAHRRGIVHRDLTPANVLCAPDGRVVLGDFGLAKELEVEESIRLSASGAMMGTPDYWAPEQASGAQALVSYATDVYCFGATLHAALTGSPPFRTATLHEAVIAAREQPPSPPSRLRAEVPPWLDALVLRCLEKEPAARWPDGEALSRALLVRPTRRRRPLVPALVAAALMALVGLGLALQTDRPAADGLRRAADANDPAAMHELGLILAAGPASGHAEAAAWLLRSAERGYTAAGYERALMEWNGLGVPTDQASAKARILAAARAGHPRAMWAQAVLLTQAGSDAEAEHWFRRAAEAGDPEGMFSLGFCLMTGQGMRRDPVEGRRWLERVAGGGDAQLAETAKNGLVALADEKEAVMIRMAQSLPARPSPPPPRRP